MPEDENTPEKTPSSSVHFYIPHISYFTEGNTYIGSSNTFNYRIAPKDDKLLTSVWYGMKCFELSEPEYSEENDKNEDGLKKAALTVDRLFGEYLAKLDAGEVKGRRTFNKNDVLK